MLGNKSISKHIWTRGVESSQFPEQHKSQFSTSTASKAPTGAQADGLLEELAKLADAELNSLEDAEGLISDADKDPKSEADDSRLFNAEEAARILEATESEASRDDPVTNGRPLDVPEA